jgi:hypothetical protein
LRLLLAWLARVWLLGASVGKVEALCAHLRTDATFLDLQDQPSKCSICEVEVPHVLEGALIYLTNCRGIGATNGTTKWVTAMGGCWHLVDYAEGILQQILLCLVLRDGRLNLALDSLPYIVE